MAPDLPPPFEHLNLEDSYFLGILADGTRLRLRALFVLTAGHPLYAPPKPGEQHCYREGDIVIENPTALQCTPEPGATIVPDPDGTLDLGSLHIEAAAPAWAFHTDWFTLRMEAARVELALDPERADG